MTDDVEPDVLDLPAVGPRDGVGLCLSGGGFRAMLFHLGTLRRLNETGWLARLTRVASVSGGSITAAVLGLAWRRLEFDNSGVAGNFGGEVEEPVMDLADHTLDRPAVLGGLLTPGRISRRVQHAYDRHLFHGATLQDLPHHGEGPLFVILSTNLSNGSAWRFSQPYMRDWRTESIANPTLAIAHAVTASSAFPPFLSPSLLDIHGKGTLQLTDGGVFDNLGLEPVVKRCATVFVSDGGGTFKVDPNPKRDWIRATLRVLDTVDVEVRRLRRRQIVGLLASRQRRGAFMAINTDYSRFPQRSPALPAGEGATKALSRTPTRLKKIDPTVRRQLVNWGYAACDAALRSYVDKELSDPPGFPYPTEGVG
ncbi:MULTISPECIES: patatin-like phospholipase family protein [Mycolicibacterium]|uniref:patatin-like phospholipase family protein n=1 Tax=Mycolicibacterium TaxID=1866885 RepID=UPI0007ECBB3C|nr:patatin-like phospholipase family protein [Mycolicibacterium fortuitum]NOP98454.1 patatin-like phospholipase family protein [Mycolicibacterium fortuitum]OBI57131.1 hypothetical protein A5667_20655 [Mycolicibacterium fortuitum]UBV13005.1 patatin-like phospholipase family protein [Mycolicibacterium fortuitum]WAY16998.1 patatin-like phospholipase family protein [Mycolicibacterium fortuitum]